jgi:D-arabinose 5-phosphate isomerase GutQ
MAKNKYDAVLEAMRVDENGQLILARIFERKGVIFSDHFLVERDQLIQRLKSGQKILTGKRQYKMGSVFDTGEEVRVVSSNGKDILVVGSESGNQDHLNSVPRF